MIRYLIKGINRLTENLNKANQRMGAHVMNLMSEESEKAIICLNAYLDKKFVTGVSSADPKSHVSVSYC